jgi:hypothetical protein
MSIGCVPDVVTEERRHAGTPPCDLSLSGPTGSGGVGDGRDPPELAGDTRPGDGGTVAGEKGTGKGRLARPGGL